MASPPAPVRIDDYAMEYGLICGTKRHENARSASTASPETGPLTRQVWLKEGAQEAEGRRRDVRPGPPHRGPHGRHKDGGATRAGRRTGPRIDQTDGSPPEVGRSAPWRAKRSRLVVGEAVLHSADIAPPPSRATSASPHAPRHLWRREGAVRVGSPRRAGPRGCGRRVQRARGRRDRNSGRAAPPPGGRHDRVLERPGAAVGSAGGAGGSVASPPGEGLAERRRRGRQLRSGSRPLGLSWRTGRRWPRVGAHRSSMRRS